MIHWEARLGRDVCSRRDGALARRRREERRYLRGSRGRGRALQQAGAGTGARRVRMRVRLIRLDRGARLPFTKTKAFQARVQRTHKGMIGGRIREGNLKGKGREGGGQQAVLGRPERGGCVWCGCSAGEIEGVRERLWAGGGRAGQPRVTERELNRGKEGEN